MDFGKNGEDELIDTPYGKKRWSFLKPLMDAEQQRGDLSQLEYDMLLLLRVMLSAKEWAVYFAANKDILDVVRRNHRLVDRLKPGDGISQKTHDISQKTHDIIMQVREQMEKDNGKPISEE